MPRPSRGQFRLLVTWNIIIIIIINNNNNILLCEFFTPGLADGLSLESEWQQVSSCLQDSSQYSIRPERYSSLDYLHSFFDFHILQPSYYASGDHSKSTNYNWFIIIILLLESFSHQCQLMGSHWSLRDSKSPQISRTLLSFLADLNNAVTWMVSTCPLISKSSSPCINPLITVLRAPITIGIIVTFMFHIFLIP